MLIVAGADGAAASMSGINRISSAYGVMFSDKIHQSRDISTGVASRLFGSASEILGRFLKLVHKA